MRIFNPVFRFFESWIDPFAPRNEYEPPNRLLAYVWHYVGQVKWAFFALLLYGFANAVVEATVFSYVGKLVDLLRQFDASNGKAQGWSGLIEAHGSTLLTMLLVVAVLRAAIVTWGALIEEQVIVPGFFVMMRWQSHKHVIGQSLSFFQNDLAGKISQKVFQSGMATGDMMISLLQVIWFVVIYAITTFGLLAALDWQLGLVIGIWMVLFVIIAVHFVPKVRNHARITAETASSVNGRMVDGYSNIQTVKLHTSHEREDDWVLESMHVHQAAIIQFTRQLTLMRVSLTLANGAAISIIGWLAIDLWLSGVSSLGSVAFVMALTLRLHLLSNRLLGNLNGFFRNVGVTQNTMGLVAQPHGIIDVPDAKAIKFKGGAISFDNITFHYGKDGGVIDGLSLSIDAGERVGIVGPSGSGKTTLVHLAMRFFEPEKGIVTLDGQSLAEVTQASIMQQFSLVQQDIQLFHRSVRENITYGRIDVSDDEVIRAAKLAEAHDFILELEDGYGNAGYDTLVGERGVKLSGGQRQRLALARAFLRDAPVLVLDEATSQLDSVVEQKIQANLFEHTIGKTVIMVAHRLSTVANLDRIVVMADGKVVAQGSHKDLIAQPGLYKTLWQKQTGEKI